MQFGEWLLLRFSRQPGSKEYAGATLNYTVENALDFPKKTIPSFLDLIKDKTVLDYGCGPGFQAVAMAKYGAKAVTGIDINQNWLERAKTLAAENECADRASFVEAKQFLADKANEGKFDVALCCGSFEHFADPAKELANMKSMTRPGGKILITFAEPWLSPRGSHMDNFCKLPYINILFSEKTVMAVRSRFKDDGATRYEEILSGLNKMTLAKFERTVRNSGLAVEHKHFFATKNLPVVKNIPYLREFLVSAVTCILKKDSGPQGQFS
jgi:SAM-dependent methyltransferase